MLPLIRDRGTDNSVCRLSVLDTVTLSLYLPQQWIWKWYRERSCILQSYTAQMPSSSSLPSHHRSMRWPRLMTASAFSFLASKDCKPQCGNLKAKQLFWNLVIYFFFFFRNFKEASLDFLLKNFRQRWLRVICPANWYVKMIKITTKKINFYVFTHKGIFTLFDQKSVF